MQPTGRPPSFRVPRSRVYETHQAYRAEILASLEPVLFGSSSNGYSVRHELERAFAKMVGKRFACAVHSGTIGLFLALHACGIGSGDEVITVANSDISTTSAILQCGAKPVLCDVQEQDFTIDVTQVESMITSRTRALLPVDLYGHPANVKQLREIANQHQLRIVEDAALATGAMDYNKSVGAYADATVFSFAPFKPLGSVGNGAMIVTDDEDLQERLRLLSGYGHAPSDVSVLSGHQRYLAEGYNVPLDPLQAALVLTKISHLSKWTEQRRAIAHEYEIGLQDSPALVPAFRKESTPTFRCYTIRVPRRQHVYETLREAGIEVVIHYAPPVYRHPGYSGDQPNRRLPVTEALADELLCLPVAPELTSDDVTDVIDQVLAHLRVF